MDYATLQVDIAEDAIEAISRVSAGQAVEELIWNALDAEAHRVEVQFFENELEGIGKIVVSDDGHGITHSDAQAVFQTIGGSSKRSRRHSPKLARPYHGREGKGRYKSLALGSSVEWRSRYAKNGAIFQFAVQLKTDHLKSVRVSVETVATDGAIPGCDVVITNVLDASSRVRSDAYRDNLISRYAPYLIAHPDAAIIYDGQRLDPEAALERRHAQSVPFGDELEDGSREHEASLTILEWRKPLKSTLFLCDGNGLALEESNATVRSGGIRYTAYVSSSLLREKSDLNLLQLAGLDPTLRSLLQAVEGALRDYFRERAREDAAQIVQRIKDEGNYPYKQEASGVIEQAERQVFDICAAKIHEFLPNFENSAAASRRLTYHLVKQALEQDPTNLTKIFNEVLKLSAEQQDELAQLLERTSLGAIIKTAKTITDRLSFINGFEQILHGPVERRLLKERSQLQRILVEELWLFGDEFALGTDDASLRTVLSEHRAELGLSPIDVKLDPEAVKSLADIPDLVLWRQYSRGKRDQYEHLVVELKRPTVKVGLSEIDQVRRYAAKIQNNRYFDKQKTTWTYWVISDDIAAEAQSETQQTGRPVGQVSATPNYTIWALTWAEIIQRAKIRHEFLKERLEYAVRDNSEGMAYLRAKYEEFLPKADQPRETTAEATD